jgi:protein SCO1/2
MRELGPKADGVQVIMVTVDPGRTPDKLNTYVTAFDPRFIGRAAHPTRSRGRAVWSRLREACRLRRDGYLVDHTATTTVIDQNGRIRLIWPTDTPHELAADLNQLSADTFIPTGRMRHDAEGLTPCPLSCQERG